MPGTFATVAIGATILCILSTPDSPRSTAPTLGGRAMQIDEMFLKWWAESYPHAKPSPHAVLTHVAFAEYVEQVRTQEVLGALGPSVSDK